ncbi:MAG: YdcF family protein [Bacteroidetes bacterium]|nr:YdcF family protein [Bacteroidota bacterium]
MFAFLFLNVYLFLNAGSWLIRSDEAPKSDVGIILIGRLVDRTLLAHSLLKQCKISRIVMVNDVVYDRNILDSIGFRAPSHATVSRELLLALGVADSLITIIPGDASSTRQEAGVFAEYLKSNQQIHTVSIIISSYHSRRSW